MQTIQTETMCFPNVRALLGALDWQVFGEREAPMLPLYAPHVEQALDNLGNILSRQRGMTVAQAEGLYARIRHDALLQAQIEEITMRRSERTRRLKAEVEAGVYSVTGDEVAGRALTYPEFQDVGRRRDYADRLHAYQSETFSEEGGMAALSGGETPLPEPLDVTTQRSLDAGFHGRWRSRDERLAQAIEGIVAVVILIFAALLLWALVVR